MLRELKTLELAFRGLSDEDTSEDEGIEGLDEVESVEGGENESEEAF